MYRYDEFDHAFVRQRANQFKGQVARRLSGELTEDEFKPLRLMNGLYLQLHAYMLRVTIPYGTMSSRQLRQLAIIGRKYDKGYGHFTTRQNIQFNWPKLEDVPQILEDLAAVEMHAIQSSGNCIRNVTSDHYAGAIATEVSDPRIHSEVIRQWSSLHPEFSFLPRKFKFAVTGDATDRAAVKFHDIGIIIKKNDAGEVGGEILVGGGMGRTPMIGKTIRDFVPERDLLAYVEAILRVYNLYGRRDNKYKARIKILVHERGIEEIREKVEAEFAQIQGSSLTVPQEELDRIAAYFADPDFEAFDAEALEAINRELEVRKFENRDFAAWMKTNVKPHKQAGYAIADITLKGIGETAGDITSDQMDVVADLTEQFSLDEMRASHEQNLILPHVKQADLFELWSALNSHGLGTPNSGLITDMIVCPGMDYCALATARSIPIGQEISRRFADLERQYDIGGMKIKMSGCINACGHHHAGHIGILGVDRRGEEVYQITLGGSGDETASVGARVGPAFTADEVVDAIETIVNTYLDLRESPEETFLSAYRRVGLDPFKEKLYAAA
ncbi:nitrite/sulfite reductase [Aestuariispira insulae]|uniref:Sulfite reductase (NADPH) hemoprotein beta-component n=1 Tax=Aestuariispira insulae TaxID=1461337 RepID=A0A3D9HJG6_9PROT|nr:nitrite/sulfite reductase [Aestuariispira insulae]RED49640.1 sulfite reductase (NADPH) hemoprotein beta-component [Aestuariispira insulae]